jgi:pimeloyl-ACP methyl ester carboxylesterase
MQASTAIRARVVAGTVEVPGARLYYEVRGDGPPLLLMGPGMDAAALEPVADLLAADHTVITADPRGLNRSLPDDPERSCGPERHADDLARLLRHLRLGPAAVVGCGDGAVTALALAEAHPEQVRTVVVLDRRERADDLIAAYFAGAICAAETR